MKATKWLFLLCVLVFLGMVSLPLLAQEASGSGGASGAGDLASRMVNDPARGWAVFGAIAKGELIADKTVQGGTAERVTVSAEGANPWDAGGMAGNVKPVARGDVLLLAFWARAVVPPAGQNTITLLARLQESAAPYTSLGAQETLVLSSQWKMYYVKAVASRDYSKATMGGSLNFATGIQTLDLGPILLIDFGPGYDVNKLPVNR